MQRKMRKTLSALSALAVSSFGGVAAAQAAGHNHSGNGETPLTGTDLSSAESAAVAANPGATATAASTETDSTLAGAKYEVKITKADGTKAVSIEDASFNVLATNADTGHGGGRRGGHRG